MHRRWRWAVWSAVLAWALIWPRVDSEPLSPVRHQDAVQGARTSRWFRWREYTVAEESAAALERLRDR